jgi:hypothetical protein
MYNQDLIFLPFSTIACHTEAQQSYNNRSSRGNNKNREESRRLIRAHPERSSPIFHSESPLKKMMASRASAATSSGAVRHIAINCQYIG